MSLSTRRQDQSVISTVSRSRRAAVLGGAAIAAGIALLLVATEPRLAIVWDEGYTLGREDRVRAWFAALRDPSAFAKSFNPGSLRILQDRLSPPSPDQMDTRAELLSSPRVVAWFWPFAREEPHGHPPFYAIVGLIGDVLVPSWEALPRARLGPMLVFAATGGALFAFAARRWGLWAASAAAGAWTLQPRLFAHAHYATYDALLTTLWVAAVLAFLLAVERPEPTPKRPRWGWVVVFGVLQGWAMGTKLTGWFLPLPCLAWAVLYRDRRAFLALLTGGLVALVTLHAFTPPWWSAPLSGVVAFLQSNLTRGETIPIETLFLGRVYETPTGSLPWYNTLVWTLFVVPVGFLLLALLGAGRAAARLGTERAGVLLAGHWLFFLVLRALPHTPGHDGVRQFLPAFGLLAAVAGLGAAWAVDRWGRWGKAMVGIALAEGAISVAAMMPVPLSYYSPAVGGLPGATALGMEPTYYWDALTPEALDWLNRNTPEGRTVLFATNPTSWYYLLETGRLRARLAPIEPGVPAWYVLQNRPGAMSPLDRRLVARGGGHVLSSKLGVPLVWAFSYEAFLQARAEEPAQ